MQDCTVPEEFGVWGLGFRDFSLHKDMQDCTVPEEFVSARECNQKLVAWGKAASAPEGEHCLANALKLFLLPGNILQI
jgi:hypothetical protein